MAWVSNPRLHVCIAFLFGFALGFVCCWAQVQTAPTLPMNTILGLSQQLVASTGTPVAAATTPASWRESNREKELQRARKRESKALVESEKRSAALQDELGESRAQVLRLQESLKAKEVSVLAQVSVASPTTPVALATASTPVVSAMSQDLSPLVTMKSPQNPHTMPVTATMLVTIGQSSYVAMVRPKGLPKKCSPSNITCLKLLSWQVTPMMPATPHGVFELPPHIDSVIIDVGTHDSFTWGQPHMKMWKSSKNTFLFAIEPGDNAFGTLSEARRQLKGHLRERVHLIQAAVGPGPLPFAQLQVSHHSLCNSVLGFNPDAVKELGWTCAEKLGTNTVPLMPLSDLIGYIPSNIRIAYLKIIAQGFDFEVLKSLGSHLHRVRRLQLITMEAPESTKEVMYNGQSNHKRVLAWVKAHGFKVDSCVPIYLPALHNQLCVFSPDDEPSLPNARQFAETAAAAAPR